jgi:hypothetical protein
VTSWLAPAPAASSSAVPGDAGSLFEAAGLGGLADDGFVSLDGHSAADFISRCARLRFWSRQAGIAQRAGAATASAGQG